MPKKFQQFELKKIEVPNKFTMSPVELKDCIDFEVKRVYFVTKPLTATGAHCHIIEEEFFILIQGTCVAVIDQGAGLEEFAMAGPINALYVSNYIWHHFKDFSSDAILLALSSTNYSPDRKDYIENYEEYLKVRDEKLKDTI